MDGYARLLRQKALLDWYNSLSDDDKRLLVRLVDTQRTPAPATATAPRSFARGVGENVVGNAVYGLALAVLKRIVAKI